MLQHHCVLELADYSFAQKGRILYNHLYFSDLPDEYKGALLEDEYYLLAIKHKNFSPRIIEWLSSYTRVKRKPRQVSIKIFLPKSSTVLKNCGCMRSKGRFVEASRNVLLSLFTLGGEAPLQTLEEIWTHHHRSMAVKYNFQMIPGEFKRALKELDGAFLQFGRNEAEFLNPSIKDFISSYATSPHWLSILWGQHSDLSK